MKKSGWKHKRGGLSESAKQGKIDSVLDKKWSFEDGADTYRNRIKKGVYSDKEFDGKEYSLIEMKNGKKIYQPVSKTIYDYFDKSKYAPSEEQKLEIPKITKEDVDSFYEIGRYAKFKKSDWEEWGNPKNWSNSEIKDYIDTELGYYFGEDVKYLRGNDYEQWLNNLKNEAGKEYEKRMNEFRTGGYLNGGYIVTDESGDFYLGTYGDMGEKLTWVEEIERANHYDTYEEAKKVADKKQQGAKVMEYRKGGATPSQEKKVGKVMREFKEGELHVGKSDKVVKNPKQAIAIALSEAGMSKKITGGGVREISTKELDKVREKVDNFLNPLGYSARVEKSTGDVLYIIEPSTRKVGNKRSDYFDGMQILAFQDGTFEVSEYQAGENENELYIYKETNSLTNALKDLIKGNKRKPIRKYAKGGGVDLTKSDIEILGIPRNRITEKEWKSILSMAKYQSGATFLLKDEKGLDVIPKVEYEWYVKDKYTKGGGVGFRNIDKIKSNIGEVVFDHITSLTKPQLEKQLSELKSELKIADKESKRYTKLKDEEWYILYRLERVDEFQYAKGGGVGENTKIKDWYTKEYSSDDLGQELDDDTTFKDLENAIFKGNDVYSVLGVRDTAVRERAFAKLSRINNKPSQWAYNNWLMYSDEYSEGGGVDFRDGRVLMAIERLLKNDGLHNNDWAVIHVGIDGHNYTYKTVKGTTGKVNKDFIDDRVNANLYSNGGGIKDSATVIIISQNKPLAKQIGTGWDDIYNSYGVSLVEKDGKKYIVFTYNYVSQVDRYVIKDDISYIMKTYGISNVEWDNLSDKRYALEMSKNEYAKGGGVGNKISELKQKSSGFFPNIQPTSETSYYLWETPKSNKISFIIQRKSVYGDVGSEFYVYDKEYQYLGSANSISGFDNVKPVKITKSDLKYAEGGGLGEMEEIDINELDMPVIRSQFEEEEFEYGGGGAIYSRTMKTPDGTIVGKVEYNDFWKTYQVIIDGVVYEEFKTKEEAIDNLKRAGFDKMALGGGLEGNFYILLNDGSKKWYNQANSYDIPNVYFASGYQDPKDTGVALVHYDNALRPLFKANGELADKMVEYAGKEGREINKMAHGGGLTQTEISAKKWVDDLIKEYGYDGAYQRMKYNVSGKNPYFRESATWVTAAWQRFNELENKMAHGGGIGDENAAMVANNNKQIAHHTREMANVLKDADHVPAWVVAKVNRSASDLSDATHYLDGERKFQTGGEIKKEGTLNDGDHIQYEVDIHEINPKFNHRIVGTIEKDFDDEYYATYMNEMYEEHLYDKTFDSFEKAEKWVLDKINKEKNRYIKEFGTKFQTGGTADSAMSSDPMIGGTMASSMAKGGGVSSFFSKAKELGKKGYEKSKAYTKEKVKEQKRKIAVDVLNDTDNKVNTKQEHIHLDRARQIVVNKYANGGGVGNNEWVVKLENPQTEAIREINVVAETRDEAISKALKTNNFKGYNIHSAETKYANGGGVGDLKVLKDEVILRKDEPNRVYHSIEGMYGNYWFKANTDNSHKFGYQSDGIKNGCVYKLDVWRGGNPVGRDASTKGGHVSEDFLAGYYNKWDVRPITKEAKEVVNAIVGWLDTNICDLKSKWSDVNLIEGKMSEGGGVGDKASEIKAKIEKAKANKVMPAALKKQYIDKYEKELAELEPKKEKSPKKETKKTTKVSKNYDYIPQRDIEQIKAKQGTVENKDILDGAYVKKGWKHKRK